MDFDKALRCSGRTKKTVNQVELSSKTSKTIFIVPENMYREYEIKFRNNENVLVLPESNDSINWSTMTVMGMRAYQVYFDHYVIFNRFGVQIQKYLESCHVKEVLI